MSEHPGQGPHPYWSTAQGIHERAIHRAKTHLEEIEKHDLDNVGYNLILLASAWATLAAATRPQP